MASQLEGRASTDAWTGAPGYDARDISHREKFGTTDQYLVADDTDQENIGLRQRIPEAVPEGRKTPNENLPTSPVNGRSTRDQEFTRDMAVREKSRNNSGSEGRKPQRLCKKCGEALTGQFVRALDGTFHLDCFRCKVRQYSGAYLPHTNCSLYRIVIKLSRQSSFQLMMRMVPVNIHFVKRITFAAWICYASTVEVLYGVPMSQHLTASITLTTSHALCAPLRSARRTATTSTKTKYTVITTILLALRSGVTGVIQLF